MADKKQPLILDLNKTNFKNHIETKDSVKILPIGILPGLNQVIDDEKFSFTKDLLHNFTFTDLQPVSYDFKMLEGLFQLFKSGGLSWDALWSDKNLSAEQKKQAKEAFNTFKKNFTGNLYEYSEASTNTVNQVVVELMNTYLGDFIKTKEIPVLRLIGSQDSVYSETLQNRFGDNNILTDFQNSPVALMTNPFNVFKSKIFPKITHQAQQFLSALPKYNYDKGIELMKEMASSNSLYNLFKKELLGLQISLPRVFESSTYSESLNIFIRLTSPTGTENDIKSYILVPLILLMISAAPLSFDNMTYGFPPIWKIMSYGNAYQTIGVIDVITISRGSMETTYSDDLMPLSVDVRLTLTSLNHHYASILLNDTTYNSLLGADGIGFTNQCSTAEGILYQTGNVKPTTKITITL